MKWNKYRLATTTEAVDLISYTLAEMGIEGIEIEDKVPLSEEDKKRMFIDLLPDLDEDDGNVKDEHGGGHGPAEPFLQHQRRDVHAARGGPRPDDDAHKSPDTDGGKDRVQEKVVCEHTAMEHRLGKAQKDGALDAAGQCVEGKGPAQYHPAPDQHS